MPNFILVAQNTLEVDYVKQACALAMSIHATTPNSKISILTDDDVPVKYKKLFDNIIEIPWGDLANKYDWKIHNRWKTYFVSPYEDAIVLDTDMLVLEDITYIITFLLLTPFVVIVTLKVLLIFFWLFFPPCVRLNMFIMNSHVVRKI